MKNIFRFECLAVCLAVCSGQGAPQNPNEYWISTNATGNFLSHVSRAGAVDLISGTANNPLDGSTWTNFDYNMNQIPPHSMIHLMAGTYQTRGRNGWGPKTGQQIVGSGIDVTILQLPASLVSSGKLDRDTMIAPQSPHRETNILVSDLTLDCNYQPGAMGTINGIQLHGSGNIIKRVKLVNSYSFTSSATNYVEDWGIYIGAWPYPEGNCNLIEDCIITGYKCNYGNNQSSLGLLENASGIIAHNTLVQDTTNHMFGLGFGSHNIVADGNIMINLTLGSHYDSGTGITNCTIINNKFINCNSALDWANGACRNVTFAFNDIVLTNERSGRFSCEAIHLFGSGTFTNFSIFGNNVSIANRDQIHPPNIFISAVNASALIIKDNQVDAGLTNRFVNCGDLVISGNHDLLGNDSPLNENFQTLDGRFSAPTFAQIGGKPGKVFLWVSNSDPPTLYFSYYDSKTNLQTKLSK